MDSSDDTSEVVFRSDGTMDLDTGAELAGGDASRFDLKVLPHLYQDVVGKIFHRDHPEVEIVNEEEKRRFDSNMMLVFTIMTSCTASYKD